MGFTARLKTQSEKSFVGVGVIGVLAIGKGSRESYLDLALVSRAFGASFINFCNNDHKDIAYVSRTVSSLNNKWGGKFSVSRSGTWRGYVNEKKNYIKIYLTRYGVPMKSMEYRIRTYKNILLIVSSQFY